MRRAHSTATMQHRLQQLAQSTHHRYRHNKAPSLLPSSLSQSSLLQRAVETQPANHKKDGTLYSIQKQIVQLQQQISSSRTSLKNYGTELAQYQQISQSIQILNSKRADQMQKIGQLRNQLLMMEQQRRSVAFNGEQRVAEKQYLQQLMASYRRQYEQQSSRVMQLIMLQQQAVLLGRQIQDAQQQIKLAQHKLAQWKQQTCFELNQHRIKNSIKMARMELIRLQDICDAHCHQHKLKTIRQLCCHFFKLYAKKNGVGLQQAQDGPELYFCKTGIVDQYKEYLSERIIYNKPYCCQFQQYFDTLLSIQKIYSNNRNKSNTSTHALQLQQVSRLQQLRQQKCSDLEVCRQGIRRMGSQIEKGFGMQSLAMIEYLRQRNNNKYDIKQIKGKLKQSKKELNSRIARIRQAHLNIKHLEHIICRDVLLSDRIPNQASITSIKLQIDNHQLILSDIEAQLQKHTHDRDRLQTFISDAVTRWRQREEKKEQLKLLYQQLSQAKHTNNYALTRNEQNKQQPAIIAQSNYTNRLVRRDSSGSLLQSKSVLALSNPFKTVMEKQTNIYQPIIQDCQLILSKQLSRHKNKPSNTQIKTETAKKSSVFSRSLKQNYCQNKSTVKSKSMLMSQTNYTISAKPSTTLQSHNKRRKAEECHKQSLSKLLLSKFNR